MCARQTFATLMYLPKLKKGSATTMQRICERVCCKGSPEVCAIILYVWLCHPYCILNFRMILILLHCTSQTTAHLRAGRCKTSRGTVVDRSSHNCRRSLLLGTHLTGQPKHAPAWQGYAILRAHFNLRFVAFTVFPEMYVVFRISVWVCVCVPFFWGVVFPEQVHCSTGAPIFRQQLPVGCIRRVSCWIFINNGCSSSLQSGPFSITTFRKNNSRSEWKAERSTLWHRPKDMAHTLRPEGKGIFGMGENKLPTFLGRTAQSITLLLMYWMHTLLGHCCENLNKW